MTDADRINALMKLADYRLTRWKARVDSEWKICLAFWGVLVGLTITVPSTFRDLAWWVPVIVAVCYSILWIAPIWARHKEDQAEAFRFASEAARILGVEWPKKRYKTFDYPWGVIFQAVTTFALVYAWWAVSTNPN